jgi:hypothetical protein
MIQRRAVIIGFCGLVAAPAVVRAASIMPVRSVRNPVSNDVVPPSAGLVAFTIHGWNAGKESEAERIISFHLPSSWRAAWL